jgi:hypothetical protein
MKIHFVGYLASPFIKQDLALLQEDHAVTSFDLSKHATSFMQVPAYLLATLKEFTNVKNCEAVWIWFADYPAVPFILWAKLFKKPVVVNIGGWEVYAAPEIGYGNQLSMIRGAVTRWVLRNTDRIVVQSNAYMEIVNRLIHGLHHKTNLIPPFIDTRLCDAALPNKEPRAVTAYCTKSSMPLKGIPVFQYATIGMDSQIFKSIPHDQLIRELKKAKVYCQLSYTEQCNNTTIEAMACGCVPVVTDRDGLPEEVGNTGITVPYGDVMATREAIRVAMAMDGGSCRERARMFSRERKKEKINEVLNGL